LLDTTQILEIIDLDLDNETGKANKIEKASEHINWRGQMLKLSNWQQTIPTQESQNVEQ